MPVFRALYQDRKVYLMDDPLSAVDAKVGKHIFNEYASYCSEGVRSLDLRF